MGLVKNQVRTHMPTQQLETAQFTNRSLSASPLANARTTTTECPKTSCNNASGQKRPGYFGGFASQKAVLFTTGSTFRPGRGPSTDWSYRVTRHSQICTVAKHNSPGCGSIKIDLHRLPANSSRLSLDVEPGLSCGPAARGHWRTTTTDLTRIYKAHYYSPGKSTSKRGPPDSPPVERQKIS